MYDNNDTEVQHQILADRGPLLFVQKVIELFLYNVMQHLLISAQISYQPFQLDIFLIERKQVLHLFYVFFALLLIPS